MRISKRDADIFRQILDDKTYRSIGAGIDVCTHDGRIVGTLSVERVRQIGAKTARKLWRIDHPFDGADVQRDGLSHNRPPYGKHSILKQRDYFLEALARNQKSETHKPE